MNNLLNNLNQQLEDIQKEINFFYMESLFPSLTSWDTTKTWYKEQVEGLKAQRTQLRRDKKELKYLIWKYNK